MPFDGATPKRTSQQQANLLELHRALNDSAQDFHWNFCHYAGCAIGLYRHITGRRNPSDEATEFEWMASELGISDSQSLLAFGSYSYSKPARKVAPSDVAARLEGYL